MIQSTSLNSTIILPDLAIFTKIHSENIHTTCMKNVLPKILSRAESNLYVGVVYIIIDHTMSDLLELRQSSCAMWLGTEFPSRLVSRSQS